MCRVQPRLQLADAHLVLVLEDVPGTDSAGRLQLLVLLQPGAEDEGAAGVEVEGDGDAVVAGGQYPGAGQPGQGQHRQQVRPQLHHHQVLGGVRHGDGAVVSNPGQPAAVTREADGVDPTPSVLRVGELRHQISHRHPVALGCGRRFVLDLPDVAGVDADLEVRGAGSEEDVVGVPVQAGHGGLERLLDVFGHPPVVVLLVVTDRNDLGSAAHSELVLLRAPPDTGCRPVNPEEYQGVFPLAIRLLHPDVGVPVTGAGHDPVSLGGPVYTRHPEVVLVQHGRLGPASPTPASRVESDVLAVVGESQLLPVLGPGVAGDGRGSETVNCRHYGSGAHRGLWSVYTAIFLLSRQ